LRRWRRAIEGWQAEDGPVYPAMISDWSRVGETMATSSAAASELFVMAGNGCFVPADNSSNT
jgi:hypothetical protein